MVFQSASGTFEQCRMVDNSTNYMGESALRSFAYDDMLCTIAGKKNQSALRFWVHNDTIVLGTQDTRLTYIQEAFTFLQKQHIDVVVRNSGGLAVYLDKGVLNISLIFPGEATFSINEGYERMVSLIRHMFPQVQIDTGEIIGSYCPGSYDLSIGGKKFAGISQRRIRNGIAVQIYLCVTGSGSARAIAVKNMYKIAVQDSEPKFDYPQIEPVVMASLNELLNENYTVAQIIERAKTSANALNLHLYEDPLSAEEELLYEAQLERVVDRHNRCLRP